MIFFEKSGPDCLSHESGVHGAMTVTWALFLSSFIKYYWKLFTELFKFKRGQTFCFGSELTYRQPALLSWSFMIYASFAWILIIIWNPYRCIIRVFPDAQMCAFWRMILTNDLQNELTLRHTGCTQCLSKWINSQPYFIVFNNIYLCQLVKLLQKAFKYQFASVRRSIL